MMTVDIRINGRLITTMWVQRDRSDEGDEIGNYSIKTSDGRIDRLEGFDRNLRAEALTRLALAKIARETKHD